MDFFAGLWCSWAFFETSDEVTWTFEILDIFKELRSRDAPRVFIVAGMALSYVVRCDNNFFTVTKEFCSKSLDTCLSEKATRFSVRL